MADGLQDESGNELEALIAKGKGGDEEAQLKTGKHYLRLAEVEDSAGENAKQSVSWLTKASRQGNQEATALLSECLQKKLGVDETNLNDVTWCLNTPELEKRARKAAQQLFRKINPFGDNSSQLSKQEFLERISELSQNKKEKKILEKAGKSEIVSEQDFVDKVLRRLKGQSGITLNSLLQNDVEWEAYNNSSIIVKIFSFTNLLRVFTTFLLIGAVAAFGYWSRGGFHVGSSVSSNSKTGKVILAAILLLSSVPLAFYIVPEETVSQPYYVPYELYAEHCGPSKWEGSNVAAVMAECSHLTLSKVNWTGTVKQITVKRIENQAEGIIDVLPGFIGTWLKCTYGEEYPPDCETVSADDRFSQAICAFNRQQGRTCHLKNLNRYTFELSVIMADRSEVKVEASHWFQDAVFKVKPTDRILFRAYLTGNLGNVNPILKLYSLQCETCEDPSAIYSGTIFQQSGWNVLVQAKNALLSVWNFFLDPILVFKTQEVSSSAL